MSKKVRLCPKDDYSIAEGVSIETALRKELGDGVLSRAVLVMFCTLSDETVLSVLNASRYGPDDKWEIVE